MDIASIVGLIAFVVALLAVAGNYVNMLLEGPLIALPLREFLGLGAVVMCTLSPRKTSPTLLVERATQLAQTGRAEGILALEAEVRRDAAEDPFLRQGIMLAVDGTEPDLIMDILETELQFIEMRHEQARRAIRVAGRCFLAMGSAVALVSLVLLTGRNTEMLRVVQLTALPFLYGVVGWALATPIAHKLRVYSEAEVLAKRLVIEAIMAIQSGDNPRIVEHKLSVFLPLARRPSGDRHPVESSLAPIPDTSFVEEVDRLAADLGPADFIFADITKLTDHEIQRLLREVDQKALVISLVGATAEIREKLTRNMSERVSTFILSETGNVADIGAERVAGIQAAICNQIVRMSKHGKITLP